MGELINSEKKIWFLFLYLPQTSTENLKCYLICVLISAYNMLHLSECLLLEELKSQGHLKIQRNTNRYLYFLRKALGARNFFKGIFNGFWMFISQSSKSALSQGDLFWGTTASGHTGCVLHKSSLLRRPGRTEIRASQACFY